MQYLKDTCQFETPNFPSPLQFFPIGGSTFHSAPFAVVSMSLLMNWTVPLQWISSHVGIPSNERADQKDKQVAVSSQPEVPLTLRRAKSLITTCFDKCTSTAEETKSLRKPWETLAIVGHIPKFPEKNDAFFLTNEDCGCPVVKVSYHGRNVMSLSPLPLKTRHVGQRCTLNLSRAETSSRWCGVVVRREGCELRCRLRHLTVFQNYVVRGQKALVQLNSVTLIFTHSFLTTGHDFRGVYLYWLRLDADEACLPALRWCMDER
ncbi:uncharacterized protein TNCV_4374061 [Trichonephila clavipes]|uniref:Uncharacterized protein n=1 Tax=Trichonephila clavipes TaxID=2585209 RepID=A0A8X6R3W2_TRICX|nr:uncharacterized protein TNCV_4374061 [Trichonephila clavipes]